MLVAKNTIIEDRIKVAMIDTGVTYEQSKSKYMCKKGVHSMVGDDGLIHDIDDGLSDRYHGQNIFSIITKGIDASKYCVVSYKVFSDNMKVNSESIFTKTMVLISKDDKVKIVNESLADGYFSKEELFAIDSMLHRGVIISVAAGNKQTFLDIGCASYPACYKKFYQYNKNFNVVGNKSDYSSYGPLVNIIESGANMGEPSMHGTSQSTALHTNKIILTGNVSIKQGDK